MKTIWKFKLDIIDVQAIKMPRAAELLTVQIGRDGTCLWALVDTEASNAHYEIQCVGTGNPTQPQLGRYLGSTQYDYGHLVFHWFGKELQR